MRLTDQIDRFGLPKAHSVLERLMEGTDEYKPVHRPYQIDQPKDCPSLTPLLPRSESALLAESVFTRVDMIGLQPAVEELEKANPEDVPDIRYHIRRVYLKSKSRVFALWFSWVPFTSCHRRRRNRRIMSRPWK